VKSIDKWNHIINPMISIKSILNVKYWHWRPQ